MKISYEISAKISSEQLFLIIKEYIEHTTDKHLCDIIWDKEYMGNCKLFFADETVELVANDG